MVSLSIGQQISNEELEISKILISIICLYGDDGIPLEIVNREFHNYCGFPIPWTNFGANSLKSWLITLPHIYVVLDSFNREVLIEQSPNSLHIKNLIRHQKQKQIHNMNNRGAHWHDHSVRGKELGIEYEIMPLRGQFLHFSSNNNVQQDAATMGTYAQLESMLPLFYKHQALGDDFFVDIAANHMGYYIPETVTPKQSGLCVSGQTIQALTEKVRKSVHLAPRVVVMIGFQDLINNQSINNMVADLRHLIIELKLKKTRITLVTLVPSPKLPDVQRFHWRMDIFNKAILDYACDPFLSCNVINMQAVFKREALLLRREFDLFTRVANYDTYKVFSDYGRKAFWNALKACLIEQLQCDF